MSRSLCLSFENELAALLEKAHFKIEAEHSDWTEAAPTGDTNVIIFVARKE